jgi:hypothetical protein
MEQKFLDRISHFHLDARQPSRLLHPQLNTPKNQFARFIGKHLSTNLRNRNRHDYCYANPVQWVTGLPARIKVCLLVAGLLAAGCASAPLESAQTPRPHPTDQARVEQAISRLRPAFSGVANVRVIPDDAPNAFSWPNGAITISQGLVRLLTNDQLAAVIAHELGHITIARTSAPADKNFALKGTGPADEESRADAIAIDLLHHSNLNPDTLPQALCLVRDSPQTSPTIKTFLTRRINRLTMLPWP